MRSERKTPVLFTAAPDAWNNACIQPYTESWSLYAKGYRQAADLMVAHIASTRRDQDTLVYPILFLYRQYIELRLKHLVRDAAELLDHEHKVPRTHRLLDLWNPLRVKLSQIEDQFGKLGDQATLDEVGEVLIALGEADPLSDAFRYPVNSKGERSIDHMVRHINVRHFKEQIDEVTSLLEGVDTQLNVLRDMKSQFEQGI